jgi:hypothetical protein
MNIMLNASWMLRRVVKPGRKPVSVEEFYIFLQGKYFTDFIEQIQIVNRSNAANASSAVWVSTRVMHEGYDSNVEEFTYTSDFSVIVMSEIDDASQL